MGFPQSTPKPQLGAPQFHSRHFTSLPFRHCSPWMGYSLHWHSSIPIAAPWPGFTLLNVILHSSITISTPLAHLAHDIRHFFFPGGAPLFPLNSSYCLSNSILIHHKLTSIPNLIDSTNRAKRHWNSISLTRLAWIILNYKECLHLLCTVDELFVPAWVGPDGMGDLMDDMEMKLDWCHSDRIIGLLVRFYLLSLLNHSPFSLVPSKYRDATNRMLMRRCIL